MSSKQSGIKFGNWLTDAYKSINDAQTESAKLNPEFNAGYNARDFLKGTSIGLGIVKDDEVYPTSAQRNYEAQAKAVEKYGYDKVFGGYNTPTTPKPTTPKPTVTKAPTTPTYKPTSYSSYQDEMEKKTQEMVARAKQQAKDNLDLSISQANDLYLRSTNPYGAEAENMDHYGLNSDSGYGRAFAAQQNVNRANNLSQAQNAYKDYIFSAENAKSEMDLSALMSAMQMEQQDKQFKYQQEIAERDYNDYKNQLNLSNWESAYSLGVEAMKNNSSLSHYSLIDMFISRGMSMNDAERLAQMVKNAYGNISI